MQNHSKKLRPGARRSSGSSSATPSSFKASNCQTVLWANPVKGHHHLPSALLRLGSLQTMKSNIVVTENLEGIHSQDGSIAWDDSLAKQKYTSAVWLKISLLRRLPVESPCEVANTKFICWKYFFFKVLMVVMQRSLYPKVINRLNKSCSAVTDVTWQVIFECNWRKQHAREMHQAAVNWSVYVAKQTTKRHSHQILFWEKMWHNCNSACDKTIPDSFKWVFVHAFKNLYP